MFPAFPPACRLELGRVCKQLYQATRSQGARLWERLPVSFSRAGTLGSFAAWRGRCACAPHTLILQHVEWQQGMGEAEATWGDVVAAARQVLPTLRHLMIRFDGDGVAAEWLREAVQLQDLGLYCSTLSLGNALGSLPQVRRWLGKAASLKARRGAHPAGRQLTRMPAWLPTPAGPPAWPVLPSFLTVLPCSCLSSTWKAQKGPSTWSLPPACPPACQRSLQWRATWPRCQVGKLSWQLVSQVSSFLHTDPRLRPAALVDRPALCRILQSAPPVTRVE
jgi:hypothetical protein